MFSVWWAQCSQRSDLIPAHHVASSRRYNFVTGQTSLELFVFTWAVRTHESSPRNTFVTRPNNQRHLGKVLSTTKTRSFTAKFRLFSNQLWCDCNVGTYSRIHWDQKQSAIKWACLHCLCECSSLAKTSRGIKRFHHCRRRWFGMRVFTSFRSSLEGQIERLFKMDVTSANTVHKVSSPTRVPWSPRTAFITFLTSNKPLPYYWHVACCRRLETPLWQGASLPFYFTRM